MTKPFQLSEHEMELLRIGDVDEMDRLFNKPGIKVDRRNSLSLKALKLGGPIPALWTEKVLKQTENFLSKKKSQKLQDIKDQFEHVVDEGTVDVQKRIDEIMKYVRTELHSRYIIIIL